MVPLGTLLKINRTLGSELVTRYNLYPAAALFGGRRRASARARPSNLMETGGRKHPAPGHGL